MTTILLKRSNTPGAIPGTANLTNSTGGAEVAVNTADKRMFTITSGSAIVELGTNPSTLTLSSALAVSSGGTGTSLTPTNGQLLIGNGSGYALSALTAGSNIAVTNGTGSITIGFTGTLPVASGGTGSSSTPTNGQVLIGNGTGYTLSTLTAGSGVSLTNATGSITIAATSSLVGITNSAVTALGVNAADSLTTGSANTAIGYNAGTDLTSGFGNTFVGEYAGENVTTGQINVCVGRFAGGATTTQSGNTYVGHGAGLYRTAADNTAVGFQALLGAIGNGSGYSNTAVGTSALESVTTGFQNVGLGNGANYSLTTGYRDVAVGFGAASNMSTAIGCTAVGYAALYTYTTSSGNDLSYNVALGYEAGYSLAGSSGSYANTFIGGNAGRNVTTATYVTALGFEALNNSNYSNIVGVGSSTAVTGNNQVQLGDASTTTYAYGAVQNRSDARDKTEIRDTQLGLNFIMALRPRDFKWDMREDYRVPAPKRPDRDDYATDEQYQAAVAVWQPQFDAWQEADKLANITHDGTHKRNRYHQGLIAQEVKQTMDAMGVDFGGYQDHTIKGGDAVLSIGYEEMIAPLIKAIQELKAEFDAYKATHP